jgi:ABC-2 type transport system ATP-binding protein
MPTSVVVAQSLGKVIDGRRIIKDFSVAVAPGQVIGLVGKNGAGKSTLFDLLLGYALPTSGRCELFGHASSALPERMKARIGFVPQQDELVSLMTGEQQLALIASFYKNWDKKLIARLVREWELPLDRRISKLSGGERQKLSTLLALGHRPELLILDEPASSLDPVARRRFMQEVLAIAGDQGRTIVYASHIVSDLERVTQTVWILREGTLAWQGELDAIKESVVRLTLRADRELDPLLKLPNQLQCQVHGRTAIATVTDWRNDQLAVLAQQFDAQIEVELLGLEDIFLAMHA